MLSGWKWKCFTNLYLIKFCLSVIVQKDTSTHTHTEFGVFLIITCLVGVSVCVCRPCVHRWFLLKGTAAIRLNDDDRHDTSRLVSLCEWMWMRQGGPRWSASFSLSAEQWSLQVINDWRGVRPTATKGKGGAFGALFCSFSLGPFWLRLLSNRAQSNQTILVSRKCRPHDIMVSPPTHCAPAYSLAPLSLFLPAHLNWLSSPIHFCVFHSPSTCSHLALLLSRFVFFRSFSNFFRLSLALLFELFCVKLSPSLFLFPYLSFHRVVWIATGWFLIIDFLALSIRSSRIVSTCCLVFRSQHLLTAVIQLRFARKLTANCCVCLQGTSTRRSYFHCTPSVCRRKIVARTGSPFKIHSPRFVDRFSLSLYVCCLLPSTTTATCSFLRPSDSLGCMCFWSCVGHLAVPPPVRFMTRSTFGRDDPPLTSIHFLSRHLFIAFLLANCSWLVCVRFMYCLVHTSYSWLDTHVSWALFAWPTVSSQLFSYNFAFLFEATMDECAS